jgi:hypothetical protein
LAADEREEEIRRGEGVLGDAAFRSRVWQAHRRPAPRGRGRPRKPSPLPLQILEEADAN